jgi:MFS family permease
LRYAAYRRLWSAQFTSNVGSWMQTVAAQWVMTGLTSSAFLLSATVAASSLPVLLLAVPAGALGDLLDRRRLIVVSQALMLIAAVALAVASAAGWLTAGVLLGLLFMIGIGGALSAPTWQTLQPELVPASERPEAVALGSVNQNLARAVGPAIGGALVAAISVGSVFLINAATFLAVIAVVARWNGGRRALAGALPREQVGEAVRAGGRYVAASPALRAILLRAGAFVFFASAIWALLPLTARDALHLGSGGYGLLLGCVGVGAVAGAALLPRLRASLSPDTMLTIGSLAVAGLALVLAYVHVTALVGVALAAGGMAWILALSTLNSIYQASLPNWVKARGMGFYLILFQGGTAIGSAVMGIAAGQAGLSPTLLAAAIGLVLGPLLGLRAPFQAIAPDELLPAGDWPAPALADDRAPSGPVMVTVEYWPREELRESFLAELYDARFSRRRTGASSWRMWRDSSDTSRFLEQFVVGSWQEHLRQHERVSARDRARLERIAAMSDAERPPRVTHWTSPELPREKPSG